ncbi:MAG: LOG family protein [Candidatus Omnitrophica bacterium]|nr:LOG family protein [Candidatus Omnitrophota bacterium]
MVSHTVAVFGSAKASQSDYDKAFQVGRALAESGYVVCNGGYGGVMEASAKGAKEAGGNTIGVTIDNSPRSCNRWIDEERKMKDWQSRLFGLIETGDACVVMDGGTGTLTEVFVAWEMVNQGLIQKPLILYGDFLKRWAKELMKKDYVIFNDYIYFAESLDDILGYLKESLK